MKQGRISQSPDFSGTSILTLSYALEQKGHKLLASLLKACATAVTLWWSISDFVEVMTMIRMNKMTIPLATAYSAN